MHRLLLFGAASLVALCLTSPASAWSWPADGDVLRPFTLGGDAYAAGQHRGIDVSGADGSTVRAPASGTVSFAGSLPTYGRGVTILTSDGYAVTLVHLGSLGVAKGDSVAEGSSVGTMGSSGDAEHAVPTVHLGVRVASEAEGYVDPLGLLPPRSAAPVQPPPVSAPAPAPAAAPATATPVVTSQPPPAAPASQSPAPSPNPAPPAPVHATPAPAPAGPEAATEAPTVSPSTTHVPPPAASSPAPAHAASDPASPSPAASVRSPGSTGSATSRPAGGVELTTGAARSTTTSVARPAAEASGPPVPVLRARAARQGVSLASRTSRTPAVGPTPAPLGGAAMGNSLVRGGSATHTEPGAIVDPGERHRRSGDHAPGSGRPPVSRMADRATRPAPAHPADRHAGHAEAQRPPGHTILSGRPAAPLLAAAALLVLLAAGAATGVARRIGADGAVLPHHADLLRQLHPAHRARLHDGGRGRLRAPSAAARP